MRRLFVQTQLNREYFGDSTPNVDKHQYVVLKVVNSLTPAVRDTLTGAALNDYCNSDNWIVAVT